VQVGMKELETMKGTKLNQLSPITKKMNKVTDKTIEKLDIYQKKMKIKEEVKLNLLMRMKQKYHSSLIDPVTGERDNSNIPAKE
jgi:CRISPR/Cas system endoribonuclease Cas6 (RAMP superfamily)